MMKLVIKILPVFLFTTLGHTQTITDTIPASQYFKKADVFLTDRKLDSAVVYFEKALPIYRNAKTWERVARCYNKISESQWHNVKYEKSYVSAKKGLEICKTYLKENNSEEAYAYDNIGRYHESHHLDFKIALNYYQRALKIRSMIFPQSHPEIAKSYTNFGWIYARKGEYTEAIKFQKKTLAIRIKEYGSNHILVANTYKSIGNILKNTKQYDKAFDFYLRSLKITKKLFGENHFEIANIYRSMSLLFQKKAEYAKSLIYLNKALNIRIDLYGGNHYLVASCYSSIGGIYKQIGNYDKSIGFHRKALDIYINSPGHNKLVANSYVRIARNLLEKEQNEVALEYLKKALSTYINLYGEIHKNVAITYNLIGIVHSKNGILDQALINYNKAIAILNKRNNTGTLDLVYNNIGVIYKQRGEYSKALGFYKKSLNITLNNFTENHPNVARKYINIGDLYNIQDNSNVALEYYKKALKILTSTFQKDHPLISECYSNIGSVYLKQAKYRLALYYCDKAVIMNINLFGTNHPYTSDIYNNTAQVYFEKRDYTKALEYLQKSLKIRLSIHGQNHTNIVESYNRIGSFYLKTKKYYNALINYERAITVNTIPGTDQYLDQNVLLSTLNGQAKTYKKIFQKSKDIGSLNNSINTYQKADTLINKIRQTFTNYQDKVSFAKKAAAIYQGAIEAQLLLYHHNQDQKSLDQAFLYAEKSKANTLKELLAASNAKNFTGLSTDLLELEKELRINNSFYQSKINKERSSQATDSTKITNYESRLFDINRRQDSLTNILEKNYPKYYQLKHENNIVSVVDIQKNLKENTTLLEFFVADSSAYAFTISKNNLAVQELKTEDLTNKIEQLREAITSKNVEDYKQSAYGLYYQLLAPITDKLVGDELIIIPDGPLWHLNFELLLTQKDASNNPKTLSYLLKDYAVTYANSANLLFAASKKDKRFKKLQECLAFSFTDSTNIVDAKTMSLATLRDTGDDLPGTRKEIKAISDIIDGQYYFGSQAVEANFKKKAGEYNILHLALHGDVDNQRPENSKLYFTKSKDTIEDNLLYSHELFALDIPAELTVLSACNTGTGKIAKGEGIMSLGSAFQYAGTKSLLLSSWEVSDQTTPELMKYFYINLKQGMNKAKALQQAKLQYLNTANINRVHPFYWGGFYLVGDSAPITFSDNNQLYWVLGILMLIVLLGSLFLYRRKNHL